jgi:hypothetical protein
MKLTSRVAFARASRTPSRDEIATRAEALWRQKGCPMDLDEQIWLEAELQLKSIGLRNDSEVPGPAERMRELDDLYPGDSGRETTSL